MADFKGILTTQSHVLPTGWDANTLAKWKMRNGRTYDQLRSDVIAGLQAVNNEFLGRWGDLLYITTEQSVEYQDGGGTGEMIDVTELDRVEPQRGETKGHMIDIREIGDGIGGSEKFFRDAREAVITASLAGLVKRGLNTLEKRLLTRATTNTVNTIGTAGYDVPFANASGTVTWTPPAYGGKTFLTTHDHFTGYDSGSSKTLADVLDGLAATLHEHGHTAPFIAYVSEADVVTYRTLTNYVKPVSFAMDRGGASSGPQFFTQGTMAGMPQAGGRAVGLYDTAYGVVELRATNRLSTGYAFMYRSYGVNTPDNPIWIRVHPDVGFGFYIKEIPSYSTNYPVKTIEVRAEQGFGIGRDRTNGANGLLVSGGAWANPTIS